MNAAAPDRATKLLLAVIALALCGLLLRPFYPTETPARAQASKMYGPQITAAADGICWVINEDKVSAYRVRNGSVEAIGSTYVR